MDVQRTRSLELYQEGLQGAAAESVGVSRASATQDFHLIGRKRQSDHRALDHDLDGANRKRESKRYTVMGGRMCEL